MTEVAMFGRPVRPGPQTDLQTRLRHIENRCKAIENSATERDSPDAPAIRELAYLVRYLAGIVEKHLRDGEK